MTMGEKKVSTSTESGRNAMGGFPLSLERRPGQLSSQLACRALTDLCRKFRCRLLHASRLSAAPGLQSSSPFLLPLFWRRAKEALSRCHRKRSRCSRRPLSISPKSFFRGRRNCSNPALHPQWSTRRPTAVGTKCLRRFQKSFRATRSVLLDLLPLTSAVVGTTSSIVFEKELEIPPPLEAFDTGACCCQLFPTAA